MVLGERIERVCVTSLLVDSSAAPAISRVLPFPDCVLPKTLSPRRHNRPIFGCVSLPRQACQGSTPGLAGRISARDGRPRGRGAHG